jgi:hypothetical protein
MTQIIGTIQAAGEAHAVTIQPASGENVVVFIISGDYTGFEGIFETSSNGTVWTPLTGIAMANYNPDGPYITPQPIGAQSWGFNIIPLTTNKFVRLRPLAYSSGAVNVIVISVTLAGGLPIILPPVSTPVDRSLTGAASQIAPAMPAVVGKTNYVQRIAVDGKGATAGSVQAALLSGLAVGTLAFLFVVPAGASTPLGGGKFDITFATPFAASAPNTAITLTVPSFGSGNVYSQGIIQGYVQ